MVIIEGSEFLTLCKPVYPNYQIYDCFSRVDKRVGFSEPYIILIPQYFAKKSKKVIIEGSEFLSVCKPVCRNYWI